MKTFFYLFYFLLPFWGFTQENPVPNVAPLSENKMKALTESNNQFALNFYQALKKNSPDNLFFSPFSLHTAFGMLYNGAVNSSKEELEKVFSLPNTPNLAQDFQDISKQLGKLNDGKRQIDIANSIWINHNFVAKEGFINHLKKYFDVFPHPVDFRHPHTAELINQWVKQATENKIPEIVKTLPPNLVLALINVLYFKDQWEKPFNPQKTQDEYFSLDNGEKEIAKMMQNNGDFKYFEDTQVEVLELPFQDKKFSIWIALPKGGQKLSDLENNLTINQLQNWLTKSTSQKIDLIKIPQFKIEQDSPAKVVLAQMGANKIFTGGFENIAEGVYVGDVKHKAVIELNENGIEAAAATMISVERSFHKEEKFQKTFIANHPFLFLIRENIFGSILFVGRLQNPAQP